MIKSFDKEGKFIGTFGRQGGKEGELNNPQGIVLDEEEGLYISDTGNHRIQKFTSDGDFISVYGRKGKELGEFNQPSGICMDDKNRLYVVDTLNRRFQVLEVES